LYRRITAMTHHLLLQDKAFRRRPGAKFSPPSLTKITKCANESIIRVTRGQAKDAPSEDYAWDSK
jgi:hypothetical protein